MAATFASVAGLLGLASRGVPYGMTASAAAGASVPPWLAALGQVLLGVVIGLPALVVLAALISVGAALLAAVGIGAGVSLASRGWSSSLERGYEALSYPDPAYQRWCAHTPPESRDMASYAAYLARVDHLLCYLTILYPTFVNVDDLIVRADAVPENWDEFMRQARAAHWSPREIEYVVNHLHVTDLFLNDPDRDAIPIEVYGFLADVIADLGRRRLQDAFPQRRFEVGVANRDASPEVYAVQA